MISNLPAIGSNPCFKTQGFKEEDPLEKEMSTRSNVLAGEILGTEMLGGLQSMRSQRVGHNLASKPPP